MRLIRKRSIKKQPRSVHKLHVELNAHLRNMCQQLLLIKEAPFDYDSLDLLVNKLTPCLHSLVQVTCINQELQQKNNKITREQTQKISSDLCANVSQLLHIVRGYIKSYRVLYEQKYSAEQESLPKSDNQFLYLCKQINQHATHLLNDIALQYLRRGQSLDLLQQQSEQLVEFSAVFKKGAHGNAEESDPPEPDLLGVKMSH